MSQDIGTAELTRGFGRPLFSTAWLGGIAQLAACDDQTAKRTYRCAMEESQLPATPASGAVTMPGDLVPAITRLLAEAGEYRVAVDRTSPQQLVDLRWAALAAGRVLGQRVQVATSKAIDAGDSPITVRLTLALAPPRTRPTIPQQRRRKEY